MQKTTKKNLRNSGIFLSIIALILFVLIPLFLSKEINFLILFLISILLFVSIFLPFRLLKPFIFWLKLGDFLSIVNKKIILITFFYLLITPFGLIIRILKLSSKLKRKKSNYKILNEENENFIDQY